MWVDDRLLECSYPPRFCGFVQYDVIRRRAQFLPFPLWVLARYFHRWIKPFWIRWKWDMTALEKEQLQAVMLARTEAYHQAQEQWDTVWGPREYQRGFRDGALRLINEVRQKL